MKNSSLSWEALEHHHEEKNNDWFWAVGIVSVSIAVTAIILNNVIFAILILISAVTLAIHATKKPRMLRVQIDERGITVDRFFYPYSSLESFWVNEQENPAVLLIKLKRFFLPFVVIRLEDVPAENVRAELDGLLKEEEQHEPLLQKIMERFGF